MKIISGSTKVSRKLTNGEVVVSISFENFAPES